MSPRSRGRPPSRRRGHQPARRSAGGRGAPRGFLRRAEDESAWRAERATDCWFDEPAPADRRCWAIPSGHGTYQGLDLELLDPDSVEYQAVGQVAALQVGADRINRGLDVG
ncbi:MAG TPA: hypothetical protein VIV12_00780 [Streptosporangiaceae bacterium]